MKKNLIITFINSVSIVLGVFLINGYISRVYGIEKLGEYLLIRRTIYSLMPLLVLGMHDGIANFVAKSEQNRYGDYGLFLFFVITIPLSIILSSIIYFGHIAGINSLLAIPILWYSLSISAHNQTFGLYRGKFKFIVGNTIQLFSSALIPLIIIFMTGNISIIFYSIGISVLSLSIISYISLNRGFSFKDINWLDLKKLFRYGIERIPSFFFQAVLLTSIPLLIATESSFTEIAYFNTSLSLLRSFLIIIGPIGLVLLPEVSRGMKSSKNKNIAINVVKVIRITLLVSTFSTVILFLYGPNLVEYWLGQMSNEGRLIIRGIVLSIPFYAMVGIIRSPIDAAHERGYNSIIFTISALILLASYFTLKYFDVPSVQSGIYSVIIGYSSASILGGHYIKKLFKIKPIDAPLVIHILILVIAMIVFFYVIEMIVIITIFKIITFLIIATSFLVLLLNTYYKKLNLLGK